MTTTETTKTYNGWTNYETWCVSLWLDNDEGTYNDIRHIVADVANENPGSVYAMADAVKEYVEELPEYVTVSETASFVLDLLNAAMSEVNWDEIATNLLSE